MSKPKPTIGVTGPERGGLVAWWMTALALRRADARPLRIRPGYPLQRGALDALVIGGGTDVDPFQYGQDSALPEDEPQRRHSLSDWLVSLLLGVFRIVFARHSEQGYDPLRDQLEKGLIQHALQCQLPVLGICRGAQLMNVTLGGTLHQNIGHLYSEETGNIRSVLPRKTIAIEAASHLQRILDTRTCPVNALHRQSVDQLGEDISVSAREPSGVVQAIEKNDHPFYIGVQWHPEYMPQSKTQQRLFRGLVRCAVARSATATATPPARPVR